MRAYPRDKLIHELFEEQVDRTPDAIALVYEGESLTYAELDRRANRLANYLREHRICAGEYVPVFMPRCPHLIIAQLAVLKAGGTYVPLDPSTPADRLKVITRDCGASRLLATQARLAEFEEERIEWINCAQIAQTIGSAREGNAHARADTPPSVYVMYTSGSTGIPKGVVVTHAAVNRLVINNGYAQIAAEDCIGHCSNPAFDAATFEIWGALLNGARLAIVPHEVVLESSRFADFLARHQVTVLFQTTALFNQHCAARPDIFAGLRYVLFGGEPADASAVRKVLRAGPPAQLLNVYGPTETTTFASSYSCLAVADDESSLPIGRPIANTQIYVLGSGLQPAPIGVTGEICIGGDGVALGYLNRAELTQERFLTDPFSCDRSARLYRTGDLGRWRADGVLECLGRDDHQVKVRGFRIELGEIEMHSRAHPAVDEAVVTLREDVPGEKRLAAYVTCHEGATAKSDELRAHLRAFLPEYMVPNAFAFLDKLPLTANGKLDRRALPIPESPEDATQAHQPPEGDIEQAVARIWREVLNVEHVGRHSNFFELGGHSLLATRVVTRIGDELDLELSLRTLFDQPTVRGLSESIVREIAIEVSTEVM